MMSVKLVGKQPSSILMKGHIATRILLKEVQNEVYGLDKEAFLSHISVISIPEYQKLLYVSDAFINVIPTEEEKEKITKNAICLVKSLGVVKPKVVLVSSLESLVKDTKPKTEAINIVNKLKESEEYYIGGPFQIDIALSHEAAKTKNINHVVAGDADVLIFPGLESANTFYKSTTVFNSSIPAGLVVGGKNPVVLTSRSDSYKSRLYSIALAAVSTRSLDDE